MLVEIDDFVKRIAIFILSDEILQNTKILNNVF